MVEDQSLGERIRGPAMPQRLQTRLREAAVRVSYGDGELVHARGDHKPGLSLIHKGAVRFVNQGLDGSVVSTGILGPGQFFGEATLFADLPRTHNAIAVGATIIDQVAKQRFDAIFDEEPELARVMLRATTQRLYLALDILDDLRRLPLKTRAAKMIAIHAAVSREKNSVKLNQSELAFTLGVSRVALGKALGELQKDGLIKLGYKRIDIPDALKLKGWIAKNDPLRPLGPE